jgi:hypothetical protein
LAKWCRSCEVGKGANYYQAVVHTHAPEAHVILKASFDRIWQSDALLDETNGWYWGAVDAIFCLQYLLELNHDAESYRFAYEKLKEHPAEGIRRNAERYLDKYYINR